MAHASVIQTLEHKAISRSGEGLPRCSLLRIIPSVEQEIDCKMQSNLVRSCPQRIMNARINSVYSQVFLLLGAPDKNITERDYEINGCLAHSFTIEYQTDKPSFRRMDCLLTKPD